MIPRVQHHAPAFRAPVVRDGELGELSSSDLRGRYAVIFFYPLDFTFVCPTEIRAFGDRYDEFQARDAQVIGCSVDSVHAHLIWLRQPRREGGIAGVKLPLIGDVRREVATAFGVLTDEGVALRATFILDRDGIIRHVTLNDLPLGRSVDETLRVLDALRYHEEHGEVCPAGWRPGEATITPEHEAARTYFEGAEEGR